MSVLCMPCVGTPISYLAGGGGGNGGEGGEGNCWSGECTISPTCGNLQIPSNFGSGGGISDGQNYKKKFLWWWSCYC